MSIVLQAIQNAPADRIALVGDARSLTYGALKEEIEAHARLLAGITVVGLAVDNGPEWIIWDLACVAAQVPCVPLPPFFTTEQIDHAARAAGLSHIIRSHGLRRLDAATLSTLPPQTAKITFTSGTTGMPKGVCLSQAGMEQVAESIAGILDHQYAARHLSVLPLAVLLENIAGVYATLLVGGCMYVPSLETIGFAKPFQPDFSALTAYMKDRAITSAIMVPEILRGLMATMPSLPDLLYLAVGGSKISAALIETARGMGLPVYEGYGLSECASVVSLNTPTANKTGTTGKLLPHIEMENINGEIVITNPAFLGYINQPASGSFATGDIGMLDEQGYLHINGRKKNVLITSYGRNISPEWVESVLLNHPHILQAVVYGDGQPFLSALIVPTSAHAPVETIIRDINAHLPEYARIENFQIVAPFNTADGTLTGTGRPRRAAILKHYNKENDHEFLRQAG
jgi:long-chain acyl-CoA synthetase